VSGTLCFGSCSRGIPHLLYKTMMQACVLRDRHQNNNNRKMTPHCTVVEDYCKRYDHCKPFLRGSRNVTERLQSFVLPIRRGKMLSNVNCRGTCPARPSSLNAKFCFPIILMRPNVRINAPSSFPILLGHMDADLLEIPISFQPCVLRLVSSRAFCPVVLSKGSFS
jgi:hypothetical protein